MLPTEGQETETIVVPRSVIDRWWVRILITLGILILASFVSFPFASNEFAAASIVYCTLGVSIVAIELFRPGGSALSSGLGFSSYSIRQIIGGGGGATLILGITVLFAIAMGGVLAPSGNGLIFSEMMVLVIMSAGEEFLFRGTIFSALRERFGKWVAVGVTSAIFGAAHIANPGASVMAIVNVTLAGAVLGIMVAQTYSLWMSISFHIVWNASVRIFIGAVSGNFSEPGITTLDTSTIAPSLRWLISGPFGIEEGAIITLLLVAGFVLVHAVIRPDRYVRAARLRVVKSSARVQHG